VSDAWSGRNRRLPAERLSSVDYRIYTLGSVVVDMGKGFRQKMNPWDAASAQTPGAPPLHLFRQ